MARPELSPGEAAERARKRRVWAIFGVLFAAGLVTGFLTSQYEVGDGGLLSAKLPPGLALALAGLTAAAMIVGSILFHRRIDELERRHNLVAGTIGSTALLGGYPVWFLLWKGDLAPEPEHWMLYALVFVTSTGAYFWSKYR